MISAKEAREKATISLNGKKETIFKKFEEDLGKVIANGDFHFYSTQSIKIIQEELERLGYKVTEIDSEYNSTRFEVSF